MIINQLKKDIKEYGKLCKDFGRYDSEIVYKSCGVNADEKQAALMRKKLNELQDKIFEFESKWL